MSGLLQDVRDATRALGRSPGFTGAAVLALTLAIGVTTAVYSVVHAVLLARLPYDEPERVAMVWEKRAQENTFDNHVSPADYLDWRARNAVFEFMAAHQNGSVDLIGGGEPESLQAGRVSADFFKVLGVRAQLGRLFETGDDQQGRGAVVVLTHSLWQRRFGGDPGVVGTTVNLSGEQHQVIGILPADFRFAKAELVWLPFVFPPEFRFVREAHFLEVFARFKPGVGVNEARVGMDTLSAALSQEYPASNRRHGSFVIPLREELVAGVRPMLLALLAAAGFIVLIACANVANLLLARGASRQREISVRLAIGSSRARLIRLLLLESALLSLAGGLGGVLIASWGVDLLRLLIPRDAAFLGTRDFAMSRSVLLFTSALCVGTSLLAGLLPALQASRQNVNDGLKDGGRSTAGPKRRRLRAGLVMAEVALSLVLLAGAGLMIRTLVLLTKVAPGFETRRVLALSMELPGQRYATSERIASFYEGLIERLLLLPGVEAAGAISQVALSGNDARTGVTVENREPRPDEPTRMHHRIVTPGYFETLRVPLRAGRWPDRRDTSKAPPVLVVNETAARRYWGSESPIGTRVRLGGSDIWREVIGVAGDVKHWGLDARVNPEMYLPFAQSPSPFMTVLTRTSGDPLTTAAPLREALRGLDPDLPLGSLRTMDDLVSFSVSPRRFFLSLMATFAVLALVLASVGIYGVMAVDVAQRTHEIGVRVSLGARFADIQRLVLGEALRVGIAGVAIGLLAALGLGRFIRSQLFGVESSDPMTLGAAGLLLLGAALLAAFVPALRATRVDPTVALRCD